MNVKIKSDKNIYIKTEGEIYVKNYDVIPKIAMIPFVDWRRKMQFLFVISRSNYRARLFIQKRVQTKKTKS